MKEISVIIPCYNVEKYLSDCLDSIFNQSIDLDLLEIVLVDDASTDHTADIIRAYEAKYPDYIKAIFCDENGRQGRARNIGLLYAEGKYISFVDSDDWIHKDMYQILYEIAEEEQVDIIEFRYENVFEKKPDQEFDNLNYQIFDYSNKRYDIFAIMNGNVLSTGCIPKFYTRKLLDEAGVSFPEKVMYEEPYFTFPLKFYAKKICITDMVLYYYRYNPNSTMIHDMEDFSTITDHLKVQMELYEIMKKKSFFLEYKEEIDFYFINSFAIEPFFFARMRNKKILFPVYRFICTVLRREVPNYTENKYLEIIGSEEQLYYFELIKRYHENMTEEEWINLENSLRYNRSL